MKPCATQPRQQQSLSKRLWKLIWVSIWLKEQLKQDPLPYGIRLVVEAGLSYIYPTPAPTLADMPAPKTRAPGAWAACYRAPIPQTVTYEIDSFEAWN